MVDDRAIRRGAVTMTVVAVVVQSWKGETPESSQAAKAIKFTLSLVPSGYEVLTLLNSKKIQLNIL